MIEYDTGELDCYDRIGEFDELKFSISHWIEVIEHAGDMDGDLSVLRSI